MRTTRRFQEPRARALDLRPRQPPRRQLDPELHPRGTRQRGRVQEEPLGAIAREILLGIAGAVAAEDAVVRGGVRVEVERQRERQPWLGGEHRIHPLHHLHVHETVVRGHELRRIESLLGNAGDVEQSLQARDQPAADFLIFQREHLLDADSSAVDSLFEERSQLCGKVAALSVQAIDRAARVKLGELQRRAFGGCRQVELMPRHGARTGVYLRCRDRDLFEILGNVLDVLVLLDCELRDLDAPTQTSLPPESRFAPARRDPRRCRRRSQRLDREPPQPLAGSLPSRHECARRSRGSGMSGPRSRTRAGQLRRPRLRIHGRARLRGQPRSQRSAQAALSGVRRRRSAMRRCRCPLALCEPDGRAGPRCGRCEP